MPSLDVKLMTKNQDLSFQRHPGPEQEGQHRPDQAASFSHETEALRDSASRTSRIRFPIGTGGEAQNPVMTLSVATIDHGSTKRRRPAEMVETADPHTAAYAK